VTFILVFIIVLALSIAYHRKHPPTPAQRYKAQQNRKAVAQVAGIAAVTTCIKLIKEKE
jgi:hypothetical protein